MSALGRGRRSFRLAQRPSRLAVLGEPGRTLCESSAEPFTAPLDLGSPPVPSGTPRAQRLAASADRPALRVGSTSSPCRSQRIEHHSLHPSTTTPKPGRWERALLTHGPLKRVARLGRRSLPPALSARDSPRRPPSAPPQGPSDPRPARVRPAVGPGPGRSGPVRPRPGPVPPLRGCEFFVICTVYAAGLMSCKWLCHSDVRCP